MKYDGRIYFWKYNWKVKYQRQKEKVREMEYNGMEKLMHERQEGWGKA